MTPAEITTVASMTAAALSRPDSARHFVSSMMKISDALSRVADYSSPVFSNDQITALQSAGEQAVAAAELRMETGDDSPTIQMEIVQAIYKLRKDLEDINTWRRHYLTSRE